MPENSGGNRNKNKAALTASKSNKIRRFLLSEKTTGKRKDRFIEESL
jgi:hypothetical protein